MSHSPVTVAPEAPIEEVARILVENGIHRVPVVDDQEVLAGIITTIELVRLLAERRIGVIA